MWSEVLCLSTPTSSCVAGGSQYLGVLLKTGPFMSLLLLNSSDREGIRNAVSDF